MVMTRGRPYGHLVPGGLVRMNMIDLEVHVTQERSRTAPGLVMDTRIAMYAILRVRPSLRAKRVHCDQGRLTRGPDWRIGVQRVCPGDVHAGGVMFTALGPELFEPPRSRSMNCKNETLRRRTWV